MGMTREDIIDRVNVIIEEYNTAHGGKGGLAYFGRLVKLDSAVLSPLLSGKYKGDVQKQFDILENYFTLKDEMNGSFEEIHYAPISTSKKVYNTIRSCHIKGGFAIVTGDAGIGKTKAIMKYREDNPESAVVISVNPCQKSAKSVLKLLALKLNVPLQQSSDDMWFSIVGKLHDGMVVIVDEAQLLTYQAIETLRSIADYYDNNGQTLGVALIGNNGIRERIEGKTREIYRQVNNRTWQRPFLQTTDIKIDDIRQLFPVLDPDSPEIRFLLKISHSAEGIRGAVRLFGNAFDNEHYDLRGLAEMAKSMRIDLHGLDLKNI